MTIPEATPRRRTDGAPPPINRKRIKEKHHAIPTYAQKPDEETVQIETSQEAKVLTSAFKLLPIKVKGVCPYCSQRIGKGIFGHMQACQHTANSRTE